MAELIITEKPSSAKKIADALADGKPLKESVNKVSYYKITHKNKDIIVAAAVGHLYTVGEKEKTPWSRFPVFDVEWIPTFEADKTAKFSKKYLDVLKKVSKQAKEFTVATDYDIEGEVIGLNIVRKICKAKDASRMKFSTLTKPDLLKAYENKASNLDWGQANAGETRHVLDFYYGINLTRALTDSINKASGGFKVLSSGRVQGPALKILGEREKEIRAFVPKPYWEIELDGNIKQAAIKALHAQEKFWEKASAQKIFEKTKNAKQGIIESAEKKQFNQSPPVPFDLTSMQIEAYRVFRIRPKQTLEIAQNLYSEGLISYPRTSSQKLPQVLGFKGILSQIQKQKNYAELAKKVLQTSLMPNEGKKTDDAHPAIYPTGLSPKSLDEYEQKIYDLVVKRFFSVFGEPALRETNTLTIGVNEENFLTKGTVTIKKGWHEFYQPYVKLDETELPKVTKGDSVDVEKISLLEKQTKPPKRYTQSSIIAELEKRNLGTKATRAAIIDTLFNRGYVTGDSNIEVTELGLKTEETLDKYCPEILDEELTRQFEDEMESIRKNKTTGEKTLKEAEEVLNKVIEKFKSQKKVIGENLSEANLEAIKIATTVGKCPNCKKGDLAIRKGKYGRFIACNNYPDCKTTFNLPNTGTIKPTGKTCEHCGLPVVAAKKARSPPQEVCINPECPGKNSNGDSPEPVSEENFPEIGMECPICKEGTMVLRKSFYGQFLGCNRYPKCKTLMKIIDGKVDTNPITQNGSKAKKAKKK